MSIPQDVFEDMRHTCFRAWQRALLSGFNGNISLRKQHCCCVTRSGAAKGDLLPQDVVMVDVATGTVLAGTQPSSELPMHLAIYRAMPEVSALVHTHPQHLLALELKVAHEDFLRLPIFEAESLRQNLGFAPALPPGCQELADAVCTAQQHFQAVWLSQHGLVCRAADLRTALALAEELDHLAAVQLLSL
ncbi:MAG: class II aldolase/adducin family protein [Desulfovibrionaceae bacterium]